MRAKKQSEQILKASPAETFANNDPEDIERCFMCQDNETCGIYLTRMQQKENQDKGIATELSKGLPSRKRKAKSQTCEGLGMKCKVSRQSTSLRDKDVLAIGAPITDNSHIAEMETMFTSKMSEIKMNQKQNLFDPTREYLMGNSPLEEKFLPESSVKGTKSKEDYTISPTSSKLDVE